MPLARAMVVVLLFPDAQSVILVPRLAKQHAHSTHAEYPATPAHVLELVTDVQLVGVKEEENEIAARRKPLADLHKVVGTLNALLLTRQHTCGVGSGKVVLLLS